MSVLHELIETGNDIERLRELLLSGENPNEKDGASRTPLHIAVMKSERNPQDRNEILLIVDELIGSGANVDLEDDMGCTPLHLATKCRDYRMIEKLLQANADINEKDVLGFAALHYATTSCFFERLDQRNSYAPDVAVVKLLLRYNPDLDIRDRDDKTPLMLAARNGNLYIVRELLKKNASVNLQDSIGNTAMHYALDLTEVNVDVVAELLRYRCSFNMANNSGKTPQNCYFSRLHLNHPRAEVEKSKFVIKLFILSGNDFDEFEFDCIKEISEQCEDLDLLRFFDSCNREIQKMNKDKAIKSYSVHAIALKGYFSRPSESADHIPLEAFDNVLKKLMKGEYPACCDVIASGISRPYMNKIFAEKCSNVQTNVKGWGYEALYLISFYLSNLDMVNAMLAFFVGETSPSVSPSFACFKKCSKS